MSSSKDGYRLLYSFEDRIGGYTYAIQNTTNRKMRIKLDCSKSENMLFSTPTPCLERWIDAKDTEFFMHAMAIPNKGKFKRSAECEVVEREV